MRDPSDRELYAILIFGTLGAAMGFIVVELIYQLLAQ